MAALPEDDAPTMTGTPGRPHVDLPEEDGDDTTRAAAGPPAASPLRESESEGDAEDRTVQQAVPPPSGPRPPRVESRPSSVPRPPAVAAPSPSPTSPAAAAATDVIDEIELEEDEDDELEESITASAPQVSSTLAGLTIPGSIEIRTVEEDDELLDETEVRTQPGTLLVAGPTTLRTSAVHTSSQPPPPPRPAAGAPPPASAPPPSTEDEDPGDDGVTTQAEAPRVGSATDLAASIGIPSTSLPASSSPVTEPLAPLARLGGGLEDSVDEPATRPGVESAAEPATRPGLGDAPKPPRALPRLDSFANEDDDDEIVTTTHRPAVTAYEEDSVTALAPTVSEHLLAAVLAAPVRRAVLNEAVLEDGATLRVQRPRKEAAPSPADAEPESITTQAPGPLTNILRIIAADAGPPGGAIRSVDDEDDQPENRTAVMANAPLKRMVAGLSGDPSADGSGSLPAIRPTGPPLTVSQGSPSARSSAAPQLTPSSESGLRVARTSGERASLGALAAADARPSGVARTARPSGPRDPRPFMATEASFIPAQPSVHDIDLGKGPRYGLLVGIVAVISIVVPVTLFVVLKGRSEEVAPPEPSEVASDLQQHTAIPRGKLDKKAAVAASASAAAASAAASASAASSSRPPQRPPFGRR